MTKRDGIGLAAALLLAIAYLIWALGGRQPELPSPKSENRRLQWRKLGRLAGLYAGLALFMAAFTTFSVAHPKNNLLPVVWNAQAAFGFYVAGAMCVILGFLGAALGRDRIGGWITLLGIAMGGAMAGVVQHEPGSFYGVSAGVFGSLLLALAAISFKKTDFTLSEE